MNHQTVFLKALEENEDDETTRLVYADWLEEQGMSEEANRQRLWTGAKAWLVELCNSKEGDWVEDDSKMDYKTLVNLATEALKQEDPEIHFGPNETLMEEVRCNKDRFWENIAIVTGMQVPEDFSENSYFRCGC